MKVDFYGLTDKGSRPVNEDCIGDAHRDDAHCFILCDGLGGHGMGDKASQLVTHFIEESFMKSEDIESFAANVLPEAQKALTAAQQSAGLVNKMLTTAVVLIIKGSQGISLHIGDSRLYRFRNGSAIWRTRDHSVPQLLVMTGEIEEKDIRCHPDRSRLLRALGDGSETVRFETGRFDIEEGDVFLLCSDGFWEPVTEEQMCDALSGCNKPKKWLGSMSKIVKQSDSDGTGDNYSAVAVMIKG